MLRSRANLAGCRVSTHSMTYTRRPKPSLIHGTQPIVPVCLPPVAASVSVAVVAVIAGVGCDCARHGSGWPRTHAMNASEKTPEAVVKSAEEDTNVQCNSALMCASNIHIEDCKGCPANPSYKSNRAPPHALLKAICVRLQHERS